MVSTNHHDFGPAILKLNPPTGYPRLIENEHFFMQMAADCGLRVARTRLLHDSHGRSALLLERFDRHGDIRIAQEDACQVAGAYPASKYRIHTETAIATSRMPAAAAVDLELRPFLSSSGPWCSPGSSATATYTVKICRSTNPIRLAPNARIRLANDAALQRAARPNGVEPLRACQRLNRANFLEAAARLGLRRRATARMIDDIVEAAQEWPDRWTEIGFSGRQTEHLSDMLRSRIATLK